MKCNHCLAEIDDRSEQCPYCGRDPSHPPVASPAGSPASDIPPIAIQTAQVQDPWQALQLGLEAFKRQDLQSAAQYFLTAIRRDSRFAEGLNAMGYLYFLKERWEMAAEFFLKASEAAPGIPVFRYNRAVVLFRLHLYAQGFEEVRHALELQPDYPKARRLLQHYQELSRQATPDILVKARALIEENKAVEAVRQLKAFVAADPNQAEAFALLGRAYAMCEQIEEAIRTFEQSLKLEPNAAHFIQLGKLYARTRQYPFALAAFQRALEQDKDNPDIYYSIGLTYEQAQEKAKALRAFQETFKREPAHLNALYKVATLLKALGYQDEAVAALNRLLEIKPNHPAALRELAELQT